MIFINIRVVINPISLGTEELRCIRKAEEPFNSPYFDNSGHTTFAGSNTHMFSTFSDLNFPLTFFFRF